MKRPSARAAAPEIIYSSEPLADFHNEEDTKSAEHNEPEKGQPQVIHILPAVAWRQGEQCYEVFYLQIPDSELAKYAISSERQDGSIAIAKTVEYFRKQLMGY